MDLCRDIATEYDQLLAHTLI